jgi:hypothetical protein
MVRRSLSPFLAPLKVAQKRFGLRRFWFQFTTELLQFALFLLSVPEPQETPISKNKFSLDLYGALEITLTKGENKTKRKITVKQNQLSFFSSTMLLKSDSNLSIINLLGSLA